MASRLARLYAGASLGDRGAATIGQQYASGSANTARTRRRVLLSRGLQRGSIKPDELGSQDAALLGLNLDPGSMPDRLGEGKVSKGIGGFFENLGNDIFDATKGFIPSLYNFGKSVVSDIIAGPTGNWGEESEVSKNVVKPVVESYKQAYGQGNILENIYHHPLGPILDAATLLSLGSTGAARAGLAPSLTSRAGRAPLDIGGGRFLEREYTPRPLAKGAQRATDALANRVEPLGRLQKKMALRRDVRYRGARQSAEEADNVATAIEFLGPIAKNMDEDENLALHLALRGINTGPRLAAFEDSVRKTLNNAHTEDNRLNWDELSGLFNGDKSYLERMADLSPRVHELVETPDEIMVQAADAWSQARARGEEQLGLEPDVTAQRVKAREAEIQRMMGRDVDPENIQVEVPEGYPIQPDYVPDISPKGYFINKKGEPERAQKNAPRALERNAGTILTPRAKSYTHGATNAAFLAGAFRTDRKALLDHVVQRERDMVNEAFNYDLTRSYAARDETGEELRFTNQEEVNRVLGEGWVLAHDQFPIQWYRAEVNYLEKTMGMIDDLQKQGVDFDDLLASKLLDQLSDEHAQAFVRANWGAMKRKGLAIPREVYDYQMDLVKVHDPYKYEWANWLARQMHRWRTLTLTYMPRWAMNTAVGSFLLAMLRGVTPRDLAMGRSLARAGNLPAGVNLKNMSVLDYLEPGVMGGFKSNMIESGSQRLPLLGEVRFPTRDILHFVQGIEDFFRRGHFVKNLREAARIEMREQGEVLRDFYGKLDDKPTIDEWLADPDMVRHAVDQTNKFSYSYGELSPFERRYVRQFVPFWGWYKFISKLAWRMPFEMPGRANLIHKLGIIATDDEQEFGLLPPWIKGSILLNLTAGKLSYMSTAGVNPFGQIFNPFDNQLAQTGQLSPLIQAGLTAWGYDTMRGGQVAVSPEEPIGRNPFGDLVDENGQKVDLRQYGFWRRFFGSIMRSVPQFRMGEQMLAGGSVYPESIPILAERPFPRSDEHEAPTVTNQVLPWLGINMKTYDLQGYQNDARDFAKYMRKLRNRNLQRVRETNP